MDEAGPSHPAGDDVERREEVSSMDKSESIGIPSPHQHTSALRVTSSKDGHRRPHQ